MPDLPPNSSNPRNLDPEIYARLRAEAKAPYRGLRRFIYIGFGASGAIGGFVFLAKILAGQQLSETVPNFALQVGVVALMVWLYRLENRVEQKELANQSKQNRSANG